MFFQKSSSVFQVKLVTPKCWAIKLFYASRICFGIEIEYDSFLEWGLLRGNKDELDFIRSCGFHYNGAINI